MRRRMSARFMPVGSRTLVVLAGFPFRPFGTLPTAEWYLELGGSLGIYCDLLDCFTSRLSSPTIPNLDVQTSFPVNNVRCWPRSVAVMLRCSWPQTRRPFT